ncbi:MAG: acyltransferase [Sulfuricurvum sp.]|jgi:acetyltransferase-like isoleucine patch superfamily enzyme|nr:acyltransferase [Sulfuricurvum sp.]
MPIDKNSCISESVKIWHPELVNIYGNCSIGENCNIGAFVEIGPEVEIGNNCRIGAHCFIPEGVTIEDDCFIGPGVVFCNDKYPPSHKQAWEKILVKTKASIGAGSIILPGVTIGAGAMIGAGAVVTENIPDYTIVAGNPAKRILKTGWCC